MINNNLCSIEFVIYIQNLFEPKAGIILSKKNNIGEKNM